MSQCQLRLRVKVRTCTLVWPEPSQKAKVNGTLSVYLFLICPHVLFLKATQQYPWTSKYRHPHMGKLNSMFALLILLSIFIHHEFKALLLKQQRKRTVLGVTEPGHQAKPLPSWGLQSYRGEDLTDTKNKDSTFRKISGIRKMWLLVVRAVMEVENPCGLSFSGSQSVLQQNPRRGRNQV